MYCLPLDSRLGGEEDRLGGGGGGGGGGEGVRHSSSSPSRPKLPKSQEKLKSLCRSISSPMRMNEYLMSKVKRSSSNHSTRETGSGIQHTPPLDVHMWLKE